MLSEACSMSERKCFSRRWSSASARLRSVMSRATAEIKLSHPSASLWTMRPGDTGILGPSGGGDAFIGNHGGRPLRLQLAEFEFPQFVIVGHADEFSSGRVDVDHAALGVGKHHEVAGVFHDGGEPGALLFEAALVLQLFDAPL